MKVNDLILAFFLSFTLIFFLGANLNPDSISYINDDKIRPPTYPLIINFFDYIFKSNSLDILAFFQVFFWICASIYFSIFLCEILNIFDHYKYLFLFFLIIPINPIHQYGNAILTESFSYLCCIGIFINMYKIYLYQNKKYAIYLFLILLFALTLRHQMVFLNLSIFIFAIILLIINNQKKSLILFTVSILSFFSATLINKSYSFLKYSQFEENKRIGLQILILPLFNISQESILRIENDEQRKIISAMKEKFNNIDPFSKKNKSNNIMPLRNINHYASSYNIIISYSILPVIKSFYPGLTQNQIDKELIKLTKTILKTIIKYEPIKTIKSYSNNFIRLGFSNFFWFFSCSFILFFSLFNFFKTKSPSMFFILFLSTTHFVNIVLVSIVEPVLFRYSFYTNLAMCAVVLGLCLKTIKKIEN